MEPKREHYCHLLFFLFSKGMSGYAAWREITSVYGEDYVSEDTCKRARKRFDGDSFDVRDRQRTGRPCTMTPEQLANTIAETEGSSPQNFLEQLGVSHHTVLAELRLEGYRKKLGRYNPHDDLTFTTTTSHHLPGTFAELVNSRNSSSIHHCG